MAFQWRIRHKLILGLCLVVAIVALLLAGTLKGLLSYAHTMKSIDSKLAELEKAEKFKAVVAELRSPEVASDQTGSRLLEKLDEAGKKLDEYQAALGETLARGRDPDKGKRELDLIDALHERRAKLQQEVQRCTEPGVGELATRSPSEDPKVREAINRLELDSQDLRAAIVQDMTKRIIESRGPFQASMWIVGATSIVGVLLTAGLLRFFYGWVFHPIRDLERGAGRVAQGDFEHRIEVHSGDEMQDLATAFNDMTARLRDMYRDLAHQVNERSRQLVRSERLASVGFLAAGVAHEINNPLASIALCSESLEARLKEAMSSAQRSTGKASAAQQLPDADWEVITKYLKVIGDEAFRCKEITQRLLEFSRSAERRREHADLVQLVQAVLDMVQHLQNYKGRRIVFEPAGRVTAWANADEVKQVVLNLVVNALDSMEDGGQLTIKLAQKAGMAEMVFADAGCGMTAETLENIFEPFFTRSRTGKGTGLGLTISHRIITQHGGEIEATSQGIDRGSTFTVRLPVQESEARSQKPEVGSQRSEVRGQKSEVRGQKSEGKSQKAEVEAQRSAGNSLRSRKIAA